MQSSMSLQMIGYSHFYDPPMHIITWSASFPVDMFVAGSTLAEALKSTQGIYSSPLRLHLAESQNLLRIPVQSCSKY